MFFHRVAVIAHIVRLEKGEQFFTIFKAQHLLNLPARNQVRLIRLYLGEFQQTALKRGVPSVDNVGGDLSRQTYSDFHGYLCFQAYIRLDTRGDGKVRDRDQGVLR